jgi:hypothetical protein
MQQFAVPEGHRRGAEGGRLETILNSGNARRLAGDLWGVAGR